jgi:ribosomal protein S18 acetylase RimI-like enzyme
MAVPTVRTTSGTADEACAIDAIVLAFSGDPVARWCWADPHQYLTHMRPFTRAFAGAAFSHGAAYCCDDYGGAALWLPPGVHSDEEVVMDLLQRTVPEHVRDDISGVMEQMGSSHPSEPHWYLPMIGVDPARQCRGYGSALLAAALLTCDREGLPAYLESTNPRNISLYRRHGFEALGTIQVGSSPPVTPMLRRPR